MNTGPAGSVTMAAANSGAAVMIDPVLFGGLIERMKGIEKRQDSFEEILEEIRDELQTWRVKFAMGRGMLTACVVMAVFAGYGIKEALSALVKLV